jgi:altronate dehydratase small subunit
MHGLVIVLHPRDNVATALRDLPSGQRVPVGSSLPTRELVTREAIPFGHKVALAGIGRGGRVRKYGEVIGQATQAIGAGAHVHTHNVESLRGRGDLPAPRGATGRRRRS